MSGPVCIAGMHRSGTSLLAMLLARCGIYLGPEQALMAATPDNPLGYWENLALVALNDRILARAGGSWDAPPAAVPRASLLHDPLLVLRARLAIAPLARHPVWGWKDPRNSLTLPFWRSLLPDLKVLVCLRHPHEVARSMRERVHTPRDNGVALWTLYNRRLLETVPPEQRLVVAYSALLRDPTEELHRVLAFVGLPEERAAMHDLSALVRPELQRQSAETGALPVGETEALYRQLCGEAAASARDRPS